MTILVMVFNFLVSAGSCPSYAELDCSRPLNDGTGLVLTDQERRALWNHSGREISGKTKTKPVAWLRDNIRYLRGQIDQKMIQPKDVDKIFNDVSVGLQDFVRQLPNSEVKNRILERVQATTEKSLDVGIQLDCGGQVGATFDHGAVRVCNRFYETSNSRVMWAFLLAHELAHSIDPCDWHRIPGIEKSDRYPFEKKVACLQKQIAYVEKSQDRVAPCLGAHESFSDWLAIEIVVGMLKSKKFGNLSRANQIAASQNILRWAHCGAKSESTDIYNNSTLRWNHLVGNHPYFSKLRGCVPKEKSCASQKIRSAGKTSTPPTTTGKR